jgi:small-conductance mechanosensitive channel
MRVQIFALFAIAVIVSGTMAFPAELNVSNMNLAELDQTKTELAEQISKLEAQVNDARKSVAQKGMNPRRAQKAQKFAAQRVALAQSEGLLDTLKILFLNLALKIVEAVS